ncbi:TIGR02301 family protein [Salmonella enterica subsp. enterica serovar Virchow]|nr:TIGR02301 family protein [Salmonella enterica subsp. enterica serovar Virchow]
MRLTSAILAASLTLAPAAGARAAEAPYDAGLLRLAEIMGSLHFLRNLCGETGATWRDRMEALMTTEKPDAARRAQLVANFNRGYRSFSSTYAACTPQALEAINRYTAEGEKLASDLAGRYGN